ncbi:MAG: hypothetical protein VB071_01140 [Lawsonibacter sp.]|nr:hypothetical protein [Lawsonibacter sp.]
MEGKVTAPNFPIILRFPEEGLALALLIAGFVGLLLISLGAAAGLWVLCGTGGALIGLAVLWALVQKRTEIVVDTDRITVRGPWSEKTYFYKEKNLLLRRSWAVTSRRTGTFGMGLTDVAVQLRQGSRAEVTIPVSWRGSQSFRDAMAFLESLPIPKRYL